MEVAPIEPIWSDFSGSGSNQGDYINGESKTTSTMNMDYAWKDGVSFGDPCVQMKQENEYALEPTDCTGPAKFICMKTVCPDGFQWYDMKTCAKTMDSAASKDDAIASCKSLNPGATLAIPKSTHEQKIMEQYLKRTDFTDEIFLGAIKKDNGHWFWDDENPMFVSGKIIQILTFICLNKSKQNIV